LDRVANTPDRCGGLQKLINSRSRSEFPTAAYSGRWLGSTARPNDDPKYHLARVFLTVWTTTRFPGSCGRVALSLFLALTDSIHHISVLAYTKINGSAMTDPRKLARISKALSVEARVRIVQLLKERSFCVGALSARLGITQGAVSQHLRILRDAHVVVPEKRGYYVHYRLSNPTLKRWQAAMQEFLSTNPPSNPRTTSQTCKKEEMQNV
jgi:ArsR family transcriptional regulator